MKTISSGRVIGARRAMGGYSAIVKVQETDVWAEDEYGGTIAEGEAGVGDAEVIQKAVDYVHSKGGGEVRIREGEYSISSTVSLKERVFLRGAGGHSKSTILKLAADLDRFISIAGTTSDKLSYWGLGGIYIDGNNRAYSGDALYFENVNEPNIIEDIVIYNHRGTCMHFKNACWNLQHIRNVTFRLSGDSSTIGEGHSDKPAILLESDDGTNIPKDIVFTQVYAENGYGVFFSSYSTTKRQGGGIVFIGGKIEKFPCRDFVNAEIPAFKIGYLCNTRVIGMYIIQPAGDGFYVYQAPLKFIGGYILDWGDNSYAFNIEKAYIGTEIICNTIKDVSGVSGAHVRIGSTSGQESVEKTTLIINAWTNKNIVNETSYLPKMELSKGIGEIRNSGTATIASGTTSVTVSHGLVKAPSKVLVTPRGNIGSVWVSNVTDTQFTINCSSAPTEDVQVDWYAEV